MEKLDLNNRNDLREDAVDLTRRLARYRRRVEAEGRKRSLRVIDKAMGDAADSGEVER